MIREFILSWDLFATTYVAGWLVAFLLALVGVLVVVRDQVFIAAAVSQASMLGIALATLLAGVVALPVFESDAALATMAVLFSVTAAIATARGRIGRESAEAITGWVFLASAAGSVLVVAGNPHGLEEVHRIVSSSIIGATETDVRIFAVLTIVTAAVVAVTHRRIILYAVDPSMAAAVGMRVRAWGIGTSAWLGLVAGLSIRSAGMIYTFAALVLPALIAKNLCRELRSMFLVAPPVAVGAGLVGFVVANAWDLPPAQATVALLCILLAVAWGIRALRGR